MNKTIAEQVFDKIKEAIKILDGAEELKKADIPRISEANNIPKEIGELKKKGMVIQLVEENEPIRSIVIGAFSLPQILQVIQNLQEITIDMKNNVIKSMETDASQELSRKIDEIMKEAIRKGQIQR
jgi:hypothetical protein